MRAAEFLNEAPISAGDAQEYDEKTQKSIHNREPVRKKHAIGRYSGDESRYINSVLHNVRHGKANPATLAQKTQKTIRDIDSTLQGRSLRQDLAVYSGVPHSPEQAYKKYNVDPSQPIRLHLPAFTSTSTDFDTAIGFARTDTIDLIRHRPTNYEGSDKKKSMRGEHILRIVLPKGTPAGSIKKQSHHPGEMEILLARGAVIEVDPNPVMVSGYNMKFIWTARLVSFDRVEI